MPDGHTPREWPEVLNYWKSDAERWQSGRMRRFAKPLYGLKPVPRVRIPPSPPDFVFHAFTCVNAKRGAYVSLSAVSRKCPLISPRGIQATFAIAKAGRDTEHKRYLILFSQFIRITS